MLDGVLQLSLICAVSFTVTENSAPLYSPNYGAEYARPENFSSRPERGELLFSFAEDSRMRLPHQLVGTRDDGWRELKSITVTDESISARFSFELAAGGSVEIDRMTGEVRVRYGNILWGHKQIVGRCDRYEAPTQRRF